MAFGNTPLDIEFTVGDHTHVLFTTGRFVFSGWFRCVARTVKGMEDSVRPVPWKWHGIDANARQSGSILLWREAEFRIGWHCDACCCYGHMSRADSFDGWIRTSGPSPWWRSQKPSSMGKWCCRTTELLNAMGPRGVQLMRSLMSSNPLKQNSSGERMMLKMSCWPQIPGAVLAGLRALEL